MRVAVVGAGVMGLSAAWALAREGQEVAVFEQGPIPNPRASSSDQHRLIREPYGASLAYTRMAVEAFGAWALLWSDLGETLYAPTGTLVLSRAGDPWAADAAACLERLGRSVRWLAPSEVEARFPVLSARGIESAFHLDTGGALLAGRILGSLARHLASRGVRLAADARAVRLEPERGRVVLEDGAAVEADALVVCAGAWVGRLLPELAARVTPSRQVVAYLEPPADLAPAWAGMPMVLDIGEEGVYLVPPVAGTGLKVGDHRFSLSGDPDRDREVADDEPRALLARCAGRLRDGDRYRIAGARVCFYAVASGERFVVERLGRAFAVSACSGHGFKFGPLVGLRVAAAVVGRADPGALARWAAGEAVQ